MARLGSGNPLLSEDIARRLDASSLARRARERVGLSQQRFAARFRINLARLRNLETRPIRDGLGRWWPYLR